MLRGSRVADVTRAGREFDKRCSVFGAGARTGSDKWWRALFEQLVAQGLLLPRTLTGGRTVTVFGVSPAGYAFLRGEATLDMVVPQEMLDEESGGGGASAKGKRVSATLSGAAARVCDALRAWRSARAVEDKKPAYVYFTDAVMEAVALAMPRTLQQLQAIPGLGHAKVQAIGAALLEVVAPHLGDVGAAASSAATGAEMVHHPPPGADGFTVSLSAEEESLFGELLAFRASLAQRLHMRPDHLVGEPALRLLTLRRPSALEGPYGLEGVPGVNAFLLLNHGRALLEACTGGAARRGLSPDAGRKAMELQEASRRAHLAASEAAALAAAASGAFNRGDAPAPGSLRLGIATMAPASGDSFSAAQQASYDSWTSGASLALVASSRTPKPIQTSAVMGHLLDAARAGRELDWGRLGSEIGIDAPGRFTLHQLLSAARAVRAAQPAGESVKLRAIRDMLPQGQADLIDAAQKGCTWDCIKFALALLECGVQVLDADGPQQPPLATLGAGDACGQKRARPESVQRADVLAFLRAHGAAGRAAIAAQLGEAGLDEALGVCAEDFEVYQDAGVWHCM